MDLKKKSLLKPRTYSAILALVLKKISEENQTHPTEFDLYLCNDLDGHQNDIINLLRTHTKNMMIFEDITHDNYHFTKHPKKSRIQILGLQIHHENWEGVTKVSLESKAIHKLIATGKIRKHLKD